jgi:IPT/TIG domain
MLYFIQPPVMYYGSEITFWVDPRSAQSKKSTVFPEFPFTEVKLNGYHVDFEGFLEEDTVLSTYTKNSIRGLMGAITPNATSADIEFRFRVGYALHVDQTMIRCSYDNKTCYKAKPLGRIDKISASTGYKTGSQTIRVDGYGFNTNPENITVLIDGAPCKVQTTDLHFFTCITSP